jgi:hypothetical protein
MTHHDTFKPSYLIHMKTKLSLFASFRLKRTFGSNVSTIFVLMTFFALCPPPTALCQVPQGLNYQAVVRDGPTGNPITEDDVQIRFTIQTSDPTPTIVYQETWEVETDKLGAVSLVIGNGTAVGSYVFEDIDWSESLYLRTEIEYPVSGTPDYDKDMGTTQLMSVPYAMVADGVSQPLEKLTVEGVTTSHEEPLFEVRNKDGKTVFAVYNEGVRIYVGDGIGKGPKGGFAIGGFGSEKDENNERYLWVDDDSVRVYIYDGAKSPKGGFAIGGFGNVKGVEWPRYLRVTSDSTRVMTTDSEQGFGVRSGATGSYLRLTPENYFIGHSAGKSINGGKYNSFIGYEAGKNTQSGKENIFIGYQSGLSNQAGKWNTFLGYQAGMTNTGNDNTFIGYLAGSMHESKGGNVFIGSKAGESETDGEQNILIGESAGTNVTTGSYNVMMGFQAGINNSEGESNVFIGQSAGFTNTLGCYNVFLGHNAGYYNVGSGSTLFPGNYNVFIGFMSGYQNTDGQSNVFVGNLSGLNNTTGVYNTYLGRNAGGQIKAGSYNVFVGAQVGEFKKRGNNNVYIGKGAGGNNEKGSGNIFIGYNAGYNEQDSSLLYIENSNSLTPLIGGDFDADKVGINGKPNETGATLQVFGNLSASTGIKVGTNGINISQIIKKTIAVDLPLIPAGTSAVQIFDVVNASTSSSVMVSPSASLEDGLVIQYARVSPAGKVEVKFRNTSEGDIDPPDMNYYITVVQ